MSVADLDTLSLPELKQLQKEVAQAIDSFRDREKEKARAVLEAKARELGFNLAELAPAGRRRGAKPVSPARYRHPENPGLTWSGRGRRPNWVVAELEQGRTLEDLAI
jgi:DNA-binding protein H-NS